MPENFEQRPELDKKMDEFKDIVFGEATMIALRPESDDTGDQIYSFLTEQEVIHDKDFFNELINKIREFLSDFRDMRNEYPEISVAREAVATFIKNHKK